MSGESTNHAEDPDDTPSVEPAPPAAAGTVDAIVPAFDVPAPELVDVPDAETAAADFAVPPPPKFETPSVPPAPSESAVPPPSDATWSSERTWKPRLTWKHDVEAGGEAGGSEARKPETVQEKLDRAAPVAASTRAALRNSTTSDADRPSVVPPPAPDTGYRGWTITIFVGLAVLFIGAVGFMVFLGLSG